MIEDNGEDPILPATTAIEVQSSGSAETIDTPVNALVSDDSQISIPMMTYLSSLNSMVNLPHDILPDVPEHGQEDNPFVKTSFNSWDWFSMIFHVITGLFFVKFIILSLCMFFMWLIANILVCGAETEKDGYMSRPYSCFQMFAIKFCMLFCRIMLAMFGMYWIQTDWKGDSYKQKHGIVVANHICLWDGCILLYTFGLASAVGKKELYSLPVVGKMCQALKVIPADRYTKEGKALTIKRMEDRAKNPTVPLIIFPQGTTAPQKLLTKFKWGAFKYGHPVTPVTLQYGEHFSEIHHWAGMELALFHALCRFYTPVQVHILERYHPSQEEIDKPIDYTDNVRLLMKEDLGEDCRLSEYCYDDHIFQTHVAKVRNAPQPGHSRRFSVKQFCMDDLKTAFHLNTKSILAAATKFAEADKSGDGFLNYEELCDALGVDCKNRFPNRLFRILDRANRKEVGFIEMLGLLTACNSLDHAHEAVDIMYELLAHKEGHVEKANFEAYAKVFDTDEVDYVELTEKWFGEKERLEVEEWEKIMESNQEEVQRTLSLSIFSKSTIELNALE